MLRSARLDAAALVMTALEAKLPHGNAASGVTEGCRSACGCAGAVSGMCSQRSDVLLAAAVPHFPPAKTLSPSLVNFTGRVGGVFFTDLHRSFGGTERAPGLNDSQDLTGAFANGEDEDGDGRPRGSRQTRFSTVTSRLNPMQSPTLSEDGACWEGARLGGRVGRAIWASGHSRAGMETPARRGWGKSRTWETAFAENQGRNPRAWDARQGLS